MGGNDGMVLGPVAVRLPEEEEEWSDVGIFGEDGLGACADAPPAAAEDFYEGGSDYDSDDEFSGRFVAVEHDEHRLHWSRGGSGELGALDDAAVEREVSMSSQTDSLPAERAECSPTALGHDAPETCGTPSSPGAAVEPAIVDADADSTGQADDCRRTAGLAGDGDENLISDPGISDLAPAQHDADASESHQQEHDKDQPDAGRSAESEGQHEVEGSADVHDEQGATSETIGRMLARFPDRVPVIVEGEPGSGLPALPQSKFLVRGSMLCGEFTYIVSKMLRNAGPDRVNPHDTVYLMVNRTSLRSGGFVREVYGQHKADNGYLYITYSVENTLG